MSVQGADKVIQKLNQLPNAARAGIGKAFGLSVIELHAYAKEKIQGGSRSGRVYRRGSVTHQASAPGEYPKTDRGSFVASLFFAVGADKLSAFFGTKDPRGKWFEYGTTRMKKRPWLKPTWQAKGSAIKTRVQNAIRDALRGR